MIKLKLALVGTTDCNDIQAQVIVNNTELGNCTCSTTPYILECKIPDDSGLQNIKISVFGKTEIHTVLDNSGNIVSDSSFVVSLFELEDIDMMPIFCQGKVCYRHNHNSLTNSYFNDEFWGYLGCNGTVTFDVETPFYLWLNRYFT